MNIEDIESITIGDLTVKEITIGNVVIWSAK
jgi:hypothetical protein